MAFRNDTLLLNADDSERIYCYFEKLIPLGRIFAKHSVGIEAIGEALRALYPRSPMPRIFHDPVFQDENEPFLKVLDASMVQYETEVVDRRAISGSLALTTKEEPVESDTEALPEVAYHFCYFLICQSTEWGKSKTVSILQGKARKYVFAICLRGSEDVSEPCWTPGIAKAIEECRSRVGVLKIFAGCLEALSAGLARLQRESFLKGTPSPSSPVGEMPLDFWKKACDAAHGSRYAEEDEESLGDICRALAKNTRPKYGSKWIIFALDEAACLCKGREGRGSRFQHFLDALLVFERGVSGLVLNTSITVHIFTPKDPSGPVRNGMGKLLTKLSKHGNVPGARVAPCGRCQSPAIQGQRQGGISLQPLLAVVRLEAAMLGLHQGADEAHGQH